MNCSLSFISKAETGFAYPGQGDCLVPSDLDLVKLSSRPVHCLVGQLKQSTSGGRSEGGTGPSSKLQAKPSGWYNAPAG